MANTATLLEPTEYVAELTRRVEQARNRVAIFTHIIAYDESTTQLVEALCQAAMRGVTVEVSGDVYTFGILGGHNPFRNDRIRQLRAMQHKFKEAGVKYRWVGQFGPFLFAGRTHVKWCIVDDVAFSFGGINLYKTGLSVTDFMLETKDHNLADALHAEQRRIARADRNGRWYRSHQFECRIGTVLIDGGRPFDSAIYRRAVELAEQAKDIRFVSQYCPTGRLGTILDDKNAELHFNHYSLASNANKFLIQTSMIKTGFKTSYKKSVYNHAKFILFTMPNGRKIALSGSHNFVWGGVVLGTREIAIETQHPDIIKQLEAFYQKHIV